MSSPGSASGPPGTGLQGKSLYFCSWCQIKKLCQGALSLFFFKSFIVPDLTFKPLIHFELIFVYGII